jgi:rare lipoprotein A
MEEPAPSRNQYDQSGPASWYGREFQGRKTASGETFNMYQMTAAHTTYPFGTVLGVRNLDNGKEIEVRVNDRGPYREPRILDLSYEAARSLGMLAKGEAMVGITVVRMGDNSRMASDQRYGDSAVSE